MPPIMKSLAKGSLPQDKTSAKRVKLQAPRYTIQDGKLYLRSYLKPLLRCIGPTYVDYVIREFHERTCRNPVGAQTLS